MANSSRLQTAIDVGDKISAITVGYCGQKQEQDDPVAGTGLVWAPGIEHDVTRDEAARLFNHPDVWFDARVKRVKEKAPVDPVAPLRPEDSMEEQAALQQPVLVDLNVLTDNGLREFAMREFGKQFDQNTEIGQIRNEIALMLEGQKY